jgi:hypothetical protein
VAVAMMMRVMKAGDHVVDSVLESGRFPQVWAAPLDSLAAP